MLIRQTIAYLPAQLFGPLVQFATAIILTHYLGAAEYGMTMLVFATQELIFLACLAWWTAYMLRYAGTMADEAALERFRQTEHGVLGASVLAQMLATSLVVFITEPHVSAAFYWAAGAFTVTRSYLGFLSERTRKNAAILAYTMLQIASPLAGLALTMALATTINLQPEHVLFAFALAQGLVGALVGGRLGLLRRGGRIDRTVLLAAFAFGIPLVLSGGFGWAVANGIRFIVQGAMGMATLGLFSVGWGMATRLSGVTATLVTAAAYPLAVRAMEAGDRTGAMRQISDNAVLLLGIIAPATLGVIAITEPMTKLMIAPEYHAVTIAILPWAITSNAIRNLRMHGWDQLYLLFERPRPALAIGIIDAAMTLGAAAIGIYVNGLLGAVIGATIAAALVAIGNYLYLMRLFGFQAPFSPMLRILIASGAMYLALRMLPASMTTGPTWLSLFIAVAVGMFAYVLAVTALFPQEIRQALAAFRAQRG